jgi:long-chain fatty acid transport protein
MSEFDDYRDLFAQSGNFDIPPNLKLGLSLDAGKSTTVHFDIERTWYSEIDSVGNPLSNLFACPTAGVGGVDVESCLGGKRGAGFGWDDMTTYKIGGEHKLQANPEWTVRAGCSRAKQPIGKGELLFNITAPGVVEQHVTLGVSRQLENGREFNLSLLYAPENKEKGTNPFDPTQTIELGMHQFELEFGYSW